MQPHPFMAGDRVRITDGPLATFEATVREVLHEPTRLRLDTRVLGVTTPILVEPWQVESIEPDQRRDSSSSS
ncbi:MAG TPA: hypothetical protein VMT68_02445 [Caulobacteraceae bacterium]|nr:hypothetical protein [Caulobacteraceae bacterium]